VDGSVCDRFLSLRFVVFFVEVVYIDLLVLLFCCLLFVGCLNIVLIFFIASKYEYYLLLLLFLDDSLCGMLFFPPFALAKWVEHAESCCCPAMSGGGAGWLATQFSTPSSPAYINL